MAGLIKPNDDVLFQGDSITDADRDYGEPLGLGRGYAMMAAAWHQALHPGENVVFLNRGISGNRAADLARRWQADCIDLKPDVVSIMIGINDTWRRYDSNDPTSTEEYERSYRDVLERTKRQLNARIVIVEPFVLPTPEDRRQWRVDLDPKIAAVRRLASEFADAYVAMDGIFASAVIGQEPSFWAEDGVHPTPAGHALIAQSWLRAVCEE